MNVVSSVGFGSTWFIDGNGDICIWYKEEYVYISWSKLTLHGKLFMCWPLVGISNLYDKNLDPHPYGLWIVPYKEIQEWEMAAKTIL
jgi:hypothetical protein